MDLGSSRRASCDDAASPPTAPAQVWEWVAGGAELEEEMSNLPAGLRTVARGAVPFSSLTRADTGAQDGTEKALFETARRPARSVLMRYRDGRRSICLSSQSGLPADLHLLRDRARWRSGAT